MNIESLLSHLDKVKSNGNGYLACCPAHDDHSPSLSIAEGKDGRVLLKCFAGCEPEAIVSALGLALSDLFPPIEAQPLPAQNNRKKKTRKEIAETYDYQDEQGNLLFQAVRYDPKGFSQRRPDGNGGWLWSLEGVRRVLYRLPDLMAANPEATVFICEGEKDVNRLLELELVATTNPQGAGKWRDDYSQFLKDREVVILPDSDSAGRNHAQAVAHSLYRVAASVKILDLPGLPEKGDVSNWLYAGNSVENLCAMVDDLPQWTPETAGATQESERYDLPHILLTWGDFSALDLPLREKIIHELERGELGLLAAVTNVGKSTLLRNLAICLAIGRPFPPLTNETKPRRVLLLDFETRKGRLQSDIKKMEQRLSEPERKLLAENFALVCDATINDEPLCLSTLEHLQWVRMQAQAFGADLIIIDTLAAAFAIRDENNNAEVNSRICKPLVSLARDVDAAILIAHHIGKAGGEGGSSGEAAYRSRGASSFGTWPALVLNLTGIVLAETGSPMMTMKKANEKYNGVTLHLAKVKGDGFDDANFKLNQVSRWFSLTDNAPINDVPKTYDLVLELFSDGREMKTHVINTALAGKAAVRTIQKCLSEALQRGDLTCPKKGIYQKVQSVQSPKGYAQVALPEKQGQILEKIRGYSDDKRTVSPCDF